eukprot:TRINITY_DN3530_c0_g1_i1.p1 TRINITY_DN3530_c0_g1~~TRINITY_DN3530_c0_g1_i1.p1  ORF type:complete len:325 (+),score=32.23 TRINITY_DN3530_c0_g1_i1:55-1029(+)
MGFWGTSLAAFGFFSFGIWKAFCTAKLYLSSSSSTSASLAVYRKRPFYLTELIFIAVLSLAHILGAVISSQNGLKDEEFPGSAIHLETIGVASIFLLYAIVGIISDLTSILPLPLELHHLIALFAFCEEFLVFYLPREGSQGLENRYYCLMLVPIGICLLAKTLEIPYPASVFPPLGLSAGLILQGTWLFQMALSFFTGLMTHGCELSEKDGALDYTIECEHGHSHRGMAVATLQFNCHMALLLLTLLPAYSFLSTKYAPHERSVYRPLGAVAEAEELQRLGELNSSDENTQFVLDSDDDANNAAASPKRRARTDVNGVARISV